MFRLQIIRGRTLFKLNIYDQQFGLFVSYSQMDTLELPALRDILAGSVFIFNNQNLCHIQSIDWEEIITGNYLFIEVTLFFNYHLLPKKLTILLRVCLISFLFFFFYLFVCF